MMNSEHRVNNESHSSNQLNYPFYFYPRAPCAGYHKINLYNYELDRLQKFINNIDIQPKTLFHLTIGAAAEEFDSNSLYIKHQWQQLCPIHIRNALKSGIKVVHLIVTPNEYFGGYGNSTPYFMKYCNDLSLVQINNNNYTSDKYDYTCIIFNTMMPTVDLNNTKGCDHIRMIINKTSTLIDVSNYIQTRKDIDFTNKFYLSLETMTNAIVQNGGLCTCFSFAVFNISTCNSVICNYLMFPLIKNTFTGNGKILCEWMFTAGCYCVHTHELDDSENKSICFIEPSDKMSDGNMIVVVNNNILEIQIIPTSLAIPKKKTRGTPLREFIKNNDAMIKNRNNISYIISEDACCNLSRATKRGRSHIDSDSDSDNNAMVQGISNIKYRPSSNVISKNLKRKFKRSSIKQCARKNDKVPHNCNDCAEIATKILFESQFHFNDNVIKEHIPFVMLYISFCTNKTITWRKKHEKILSVTHPDLYEQLEPIGHIKITIRDGIILIK